MSWWLATQPFDYFSRFFCSRSVLPSFCVISSPWMFCLCISFNRSFLFMTTFHVILLFLVNFLSPCLFVCLSASVFVSFFLSDYLLCTFVFLFYFLCVFVSFSFFISSSLIPLFSPQSYFPSNPPSSVAHSANFSVFSSFPIAMIIIVRVRWKIFAIIGPTKIIEKYIWMVFFETRDCTWGIVDNMLLQLPGTTHVSHMYKIVYPCH